MLSSNYIGLNNQTSHNNIDMIDLQNVMHSTDTNNLHHTSFPMHPYLRQFHSTFDSLRQREGLISYPLIENGSLDLNENKSAREKLEKVK